MFIEKIRIYINISEKDFRIGKPLLIRFMFHGIIILDSHIKKNLLMMIEHILSLIDYLYVFLRIRMILIFDGSYYQKRNNRNEIFDSNSIYIFDALTYYHLDYVVHN